MAYQITTKKGQFVTAAQDRQLIEDLMKQAVVSGSKAEMEVIGELLLQPIQQIADYTEWTSAAFMPVNITLGQDPMIPIERYDVQAFLTSIDGQAFATRVGYEYARLEYYAIQAAFEILWKELATAPFDILEQKTRRIGEEFARKRDTTAKSVLDTAAAAVSLHTPTTGAATLTKAAVDSVLKSAAQIGLPIATVLINSGTIMDMRSWESDAFRFADQIQPEVLKSGFYGEYGSARWFTAHTIPTDYIYFLASPQNLGYAISVGQMEKANDIDIKKRVNEYTFFQEYSYYVGNDYAVWRLQVTV